MQNLIKIFASVLGTGYSPFASGTVGALAAVLFWWPLVLYTNQYEYQQIGLILLIFLFTYLGAAASKYLEPIWGEDPSKIVVDELVGMWITLLFIPLNWQYLLVGFLLFRIFDIWKPFGIRRLEVIGNGWGVMLDDVLAGIYANIILQLIVYFWII